MKVLHALPGSACAWLGFTLAFAMSLVTCRTRVGSGLARDSSIIVLAKEALP
jgi:hypothetical protein